MFFLVSFKSILLARIGKVKKVNAIVLTLRVQIPVITLIKMKIKSVGNDNGLNGYSKRRSVKKKNRETIREVKKKQE